MVYKDVSARKFLEYKYTGCLQLSICRGKNSEIIDYLSEQELYTSADIIFFEDIFNNTLKNIIELRELIEPF